MGSLLCKYDAQMKEPTLEREIEEKQKQKPTGRQASNQNVIYIERDRESEIDSER